jgi:hypothetical protein
MSHILPSQLDIRDPAQRAAWIDQFRSEIEETVALTKVTIAKTRVLIKEADRLFERS